MRKPDIEKAVVACAGIGKRLAPLTCSVPKEMLPVGRKPVLHHVIDELRAAGVRKVAFVVSPYKGELIERYFQNGREWNMDFDYIIQPEPYGPGHAVLTAQGWVGNEPFVVAWGDTLVYSKPGSEPPLKRMIQMADSPKNAPQVLAQTVSKKNKTVFRQVLITAPHRIVSEFKRVSKITPFDPAEKIPEPCLGIAGRWVLSPGIFPYLQRLPKRRERYLVNAVRDFLRDGGILTAMILRKNEGWIDIGTWEFYFRAVTLAIKME